MGRRNGVVGYPADTPVEKWNQGWLVLEVASIADNPLYIIMTDKEKQEKGLPVTKEEMIAFIKNAQCY